MHDKLIRKEDPDLRDSCLSCLVRVHLEAFFSKHVKKPTRPSTGACSQAFLVEKPGGALTS